MKRIFILFVFLQYFSFPDSIAQISAGNIILEMDGSFALKTSEETITETNGFLTTSILITNTNYSVASKVGYVILENLALGVSYQHSFSKTRTKYTESLITLGEIKSIQNSFGIYLKKFIPMFGKFYFTPQFDLAYQYEKNITEGSNFNTLNPNTEEFINNLNVKVSGSLLYRLKNRFGFQVQLIQVNSLFGLYDSRGFGMTEKTVEITINPATWRYGLIFIFGKKSET